MTEIPFNPRVGQEAEKSVEDKAELFSSTKGMMVFLLSQFAREPRTFADLRRYRKAESAPEGATLEFKAVKIFDKVLDYLIRYYTGEKRKNDCWKVGKHIGKPKPAVAHPMEVVENASKVIQHIFFRFPEDQGVLKKPPMLSQLSQKEKEFFVKIVRKDEFVFFLVGLLHDAVEDIFESDIQVAEGFIKTLLEEAGLEDSQVGEVWSAVSILTRRKDLNGQKDHDETSEAYSQRIAKSFEKGVLGGELALFYKMCDVLNNGQSPQFSSSDPDFKKEKQRKKTDIYFEHIINPYFPSLRKFVPDKILKEIMWENVHVFDQIQKMSPLNSIEMQVKQKVEQAIVAKRV